MSKPIRRVVSQIQEGSVLSITLFLGREHQAPADREATLIRHLREHAKAPVTLVQSVAYTSTSMTKGSNMKTWTFFIGARSSRSKIRFDLKDRDDLSQLSHSESKTRTFWLDGLDRAEKRIRAALQANVTRQYAHLSR